MPWPQMRLLPDLTNTMSPGLISRENCQQARELFLPSDMAVLSVYCARSPRSSHPMQAMPAAWHSSQSREPRPRGHQPVTTFGGVRAWMEREFGEERGSRSGKALGVVVRVSDEPGRL